MIVFQSHHSRVSALAYSPDGRTLATGACDRAVRIWDLATGAERITLGPTPMPLRGVAWSLDGAMVFSVGLAQTIQVWDPRSGELKGTFPWREAQGDAVLDLIGRPTPEADQPEQVRRAEATAWRLSLAMADRVETQYSNNFSTPTNFSFPLEATTRPVKLASGTAFDHCLVPRTAQGTRLGTALPGVGVTRSYSRGELIAFTPDDGRMALTTGATIHLWKTRSWRQLQEFTGHTKEIRSLAFSPDGQTLMSGSRDGTVCLWWLARDREAVQFDWELGEIEAVAFAPDGATAAAGGRQGIIVWDVGEELWG